MKFQHLRFFVAVVECGGVIKASERLHISQPAVSAGIRALEEELGGALFDRGTSRRLSLTPAGRRFYRQALEILERCDSARLDFAGRVKEKRVRIGVLDTLPRDMLLLAMERLPARHPVWQIDWWEGSVQRLGAWLAQGRLDVALTHVQGEAFGERPLWQEPLVAVVATGHRFAASPGRRIDVHALAEEPFLLRSRCELETLGRARLRAVGIVLQVVVRGERDALVFDLVRRGRGVTLAPQSLVPPDLVAVAVDGLEVGRSVGLRWRDEVDTALLESLAAEWLDMRAGVAADR